mmetsp:Transcript_4608/g.10342  ORF Transcript_4608/g.10342 Transcript_4608/m.10342 type:complete len:244 (-) Transcript_4608:288-1019(-)
MLVRHTLQRADLGIRLWTFTTQDVRSPQTAEMKQATYLIQILGLVIIRVVVSVAVTFLVAHRFFATPVISTAARGVTFRAQCRLEPIRLSKLVFQITLPRNSRFQHDQRVRFSIRVSRHQENLIVEKSVGNQSTGIQSDGPQKIQRFAQISLKRGLCQRAQQLIIISTLQIRTVVLMKVINFIMNENGRNHSFVFGNRQRDETSPVGVGSRVDSTLRVPNIPRIVGVFQFHHRIGQLLHLETF